MLFCVKINYFHCHCHYVPKWYASSGIDISKCIEGGSTKLTTLVDYYICSGSRMDFRVTNVIFF